MIAAHKVFNKKNLILAIIIMLQLFVLLYYMGEKSGFHIDELWSFGLANSYDETYFYPKGFTPDFENVQYHKWISGTRFFEYLTVQKNEQFAFEKVYENQANDVHPPFYYCVMHIICSLFTDSFSKWYGLFLNLICFILSQVVLFKVSSLLLKSHEPALLVCLLYGLGMGAINNFVFIRMYSLMTFLFIFAVYIHLRLLIRPNIKRIIIAACLTFFSGLVHYHFLIFQFFVSLIMCFIFLFNKSYKLLISYAFAIVLSVAGIFIYFPPAYFHMFHSVRGAEAVNGFLFVSTEKYYLLFNNSLKYIFGIPESLSLPISLSLADILFYVCVIFLACIMFRFNSFGYKVISYLKTDSDKILAFLPVLFFSLLISPMISPEIGVFEGRYFFPIFPLVCVFSVSLISYLLKKTLKTSKHDLVLTILIFVFCISSHLVDNGDYVLGPTHQFNRGLLKKTVANSNCVFFAVQDYYIHSVSDLFMFSKKVLPARYKDEELILTLREIAGLNEEENNLLMIPDTFVAEPVLKAIDLTTKFKSDYLFKAVNHMDTYSLYRLSLK